MAEGEDWSPLEVEACVADYLCMLTLELNGQRYSKAEHVRALVHKLDNRSHASVEFKHGNISAVMLGLGYPYIEGYKPRSNYQSILIDIVESQVQQSAALQEAAQAAVLRPATAVALGEPSTIWVSTPRPARVSETPPITRQFSPAKRNYLEQEARNRALGRAGELFVMEMEVRRLHEAGKKRLSDRVEHVALIQGDGLGYDVLSFEVNGRERLIEVKTTSFGKLTPFYVSQNELRRSKIDHEFYQLYRLFAFRDRPRAFNLPGSISEHCRLDPMSYLAHLSA